MDAFSVHVTMELDGFLGLAIAAWTTVQLANDWTFNQLAVCIPLEPRCNVRIQPFVKEDSLDEQILIHAPLPLDCNMSIHGTFSFKPLHTFNSW